MSSASAVSSTSAAPTAPVTATASASVGAPALPKGDGCETDKDCGLSYAYLIDGKCCKGTCSPEPLASATLTEIEGQCATRGYEEERCPMKKCAAPPPIGCRDHHCVFVERTGPVVSTEDAAERAVSAANPALDKAYAQFASKPGMIAPTHTNPWTSVASARVTGPDAKGEYTVEFSVYPPAGFFHAATVVVGKDGKVTVKKAEAGFSPD